MLFQKSHLADLLQHTSQTANVYIPAIVEGTSQFVRFGTEPGCASKPNFELQNTKLPPKGLLFPSTEKMYSWGTEGREAFIRSANQETAPFVIFGIRPCDMASIDRLDEVFLTKGYVDEFYDSKRRALTTVALACNQVSDACFCDSMYSNPNEAPSADVLLLEGEDAFEVRPQSEKGQALVDTWSSFLEEGQVQRENIACAVQVNMDGIAEKLHNMFDSPLWDEVSTACLTCGSCTFVCPTCHCFDLSQSRKKEENERFRCWDSCMFVDYTLMAGNHNPREQKRSRVRQRFMHKLCFFEERYGQPLCVGCGRCLLDCPASVDIVEIIKMVNDAPAPELTEQAAQAMPAVSAPEAAQAR